MKKGIFLAIALLSSVSMMAQAQTAPATASTAYRIPLSTYVYNQGSLNAQAITALERKIGLMATANGYGSTSGDFVLASEGGVVDIAATATAPVKYIATVQVSAAVINTIEEVVLHNQVFTYKGVGNSAEQAALNAVNQLNPSSKPVVDFMLAARNRIETYYVNQLPNIKAKATSASQRGEYEQALAILGVVPDCLPEYPSIATMMTEFYQLMVDRDAAAALQQAKAAHAKRDYDTALQILGGISPLSNKYEEANALISDIEKFHEKQFQQSEKERLEDRAEAAALRKDRIRLEEMRIKCAKEVALSKASIASQERQSKANFYQALIARVLR